MTVIALLTTLLGVATSYTWLGHLHVNELHGEYIAQTRSILARLEALEHG